MRFIITTAAIAAGLIHTGGELVVKAPTTRVVNVATCPTHPMRHFVAFVRRHLRHGHFQTLAQRYKVVSLYRCLPGTVTPKIAARFLARQRAEQRLADAPLTGPVVASWFDDAGATASGTHYTNGFAALIFGSRWGLAVRMCAARCAIGHLEDHGPYVGGRTFDLGPDLKGALGCGGICSVRFRVLG